MAGGEGALLHEGQHLVGQGQQAQGVGDSGAALAHLLGHLLLGETVLLHQGAVAPGLLGGVQVLPLEVFDQAQLHHLPVVRLDDNGGDLLEPGGLGRPPPALAGDNLVVAAGQAADGEGLNDAVDPDGFRQVVQRPPFKPLPGLIQPRLHLGDGQCHRALSLGG